MKSERSLSWLRRFYPWAFALLGLVGATVYYFTGSFFFREPMLPVGALFDIHPAFGFLVYAVVGWITGWAVRAIDRIQSSR